MKSSDLRHPDYVEALSYPWKLVGASIIATLTLAVFYGYEYNDSCQGKPTAHAVTYANGSFANGTYCIHFFGTDNTTATVCYPDYTADMAASVLPTIFIGMSFEDIVYMEPIHAPWYCNPNDNPCDVPFLLLSIFSSVYAISASFILAIWVGQIHITSKLLVDPFVLEVSRIIERHETIGGTESSLEYHSRADSQTMEKHVNVLRKRRPDLDFRLDVAEHDMYKISWYPVARGIPWKPV